jgi:hypothetical protein
VVGKLAYVGLVVAAPILVSPLPWWQVALAYVVSTTIMSLFFVETLIGTHFAESNDFAALAGDGTSDGSFTSHVPASSLDWHPTSRVAVTIAGGLNAHVAHHPLPAVSHAHYLPGDFRDHRATRPPTRDRLSTHELERIGRRAFSTPVPAWTNDHRPIARRLANSRALDRIGRSIAFE